MVWLEGQLRFSRKFSIGNYKLSYLKYILLYPRWRSLSAPFCYDKFAIKHFPHFTAFDLSKDVGVERIVETFNDTEYYKLKFILTEKGIVLPIKTTQRFDSPVRSIAQPKGE